MFSAALSVKMNILLYLPGLLVVLIKSFGLYDALYCLFTIFGVQVLVALPFLQHDPQAYLNNAFELSRIFLYKWTVNWRFISEPQFLSKSFSLLLVGSHLSILVAFGLFHWCSRDGGAFAVVRRALAAPGRPAAGFPVGNSGLFSS